MGSKQSGGWVFQARWGVSGLTLLAIAFPACGDGPAPLESASVCAGAWQPLITPQPNDVTSPLVYQDGKLYLSTVSDALVDLPTTGGALTPLSSMATLELWVEGDHLLFPSGTLNNQMWSLPLAGGPAVLLADGGAGRTNPAVALNHLFDEGDFYWTEQALVGVGPTTVWRMSRAGGDPIQIGSATAITPNGNDLPFSALALTGDGIVMATIFGIADLIPKDGGPARPLAVPAVSNVANIELAGVDAAGAYWLIPRSGSSEDSDEWDLVLAPADGGPVQTFWTQGPPHAGIAHLWPDGAGGWVMVGEQMFDDRQFHSTVWLLNAQKVATRLGCSPTASTDAWLNTRVAVAPDGVYAISQNLAAPTWEIDRIAR